jgi:hypothetical protein
VRSAEGEAANIVPPSRPRLTSFAWFLCPVYPLQAQHLILGHAINIVQVKVTDVFLVVVFVVVVFFVVVVVIFLIAVIFVIVVVINGRRHTGHFFLHGGSLSCL